MRNLVLLVGLASALLGLIGTAGGCADACADLQTVCDDCTASSYREACQRDVDNNVQSICSQRAETYRQACPIPVDATAGAGGATATTGGGSAPTTGAGGATATTGAGGTAGSGFGGDGRAAGGTGG